ncbi:FAD-dependent oxidoreductase [Brachybacterium sp. GCM10030267]|uniref:FAD-dependent oxidoreductase n=1 Tax=Brachybacterium sp. GCM10030267 TaxID=3273381 RepID=UPI00367157FF
MRTADVVVIGAGQAGLSVAYHLLRRGVRPAAGADRQTADALGEDPVPGVGTFVVLDAETGPGGAWRHRWESLTMATVNGIRELPGMPRVDAAADVSARRAVPDYFADFEQRFEVPVERPVRVTLVEEDPSADAATDADAGPRRDSGSGAGRAPLLVHSVGADGTPRAPIRTRAVLNATGTWTRPFRPAYPGAGDFRGRQLHTVDYVRAEDFAGQRVAIVGGGISALGHLQEIAEVATTFWYTRREPRFEDRPFTEEFGREAVAAVSERVARGLPVRSVVSATGLVWTPALREAQRRGILERRPMFTRITEDEVLEADGSETPVDVILWATGFRHELRHLSPLGLHNEHGGISLEGTAVAGDARVHLLGYGPSASTIGANRAGRTAVRDLMRAFAA